MLTQLLQGTEFIITTLNCAIFEDIRFPLLIDKTVGCPSWQSITLFFIDFTQEFQSLSQRQALFITIVVKGLQQGAAETPNIAVAAVNLLDKIKAGRPNQRFGFLDT